MTWQELEDQVVQVTGGKKTRASGRLRDKGDVRTATLLIEVKLRTYKDSASRVSFQKDWVDTTLQHARDAGLIPVVVFGPNYASGEPVESLYLCQNGDAGHFAARTSPPYLTAVPEGWTLVSEESVSDYCRCIREHDVILDKHLARILSAPRKGSPRKISSPPLRSRGFRK